MREDCKPTEACYTPNMSLPDAVFLDRLLDPLSRCFDEASARALITLRADADVVSQIEDLAEKAREGTITESERRRYESYAQVTGIISVLQAKARKQLRQTHGQ